MACFDSSRYSARRQKDGPNQVMLWIGSEIEKICEGYFFGEMQSSVVEDLPVQVDSVSCGVFALFYVDCVRNGFKIKPELTEDELRKYRGVISELNKGVSKRESRKCRKNGPPTSGDVVNLEDD